MAGARRKQAIIINSAAEQKQQRRGAANLGEAAGSMASSDISNGGNIIRQRKQMWREK